MYRYKWTSGYQLFNRKAPASLHGDLITPSVHYDQVYLSATMSSTAVLRLLFPLAAQLRLNMKHFYITAAFLHEAFDYHKTVNLLEMRQSDGSYRY